MFKKAYAQDRLKKLTYHSLNHFKGILEPGHAIPGAHGNLHSFTMFHQDVVHRLPEPQLFFDCEWEKSYQPICFDKVRYVVFFSTKICWGFNQISCMLPTRYVSLRNIQMIQMDPENLRGALRLKLHGDMTIFNSKLIRIIYICIISNYVYFIYIYIGIYYIYTYVCIYIL
jgi:hypothetical protein